MQALLTPRWSALLVRGLASLGFGLVTVAWPGVTLAVLTLLFGAYAFADGVVALVVAARRGRTPHRALLVLDGLLGIGAGVATALWPGLTLLVLVLLVGVRFLVAGLVQIAIAVVLRRELDAPILYGVGGLMSVMLGVGASVLPGVTAAGLALLLGTYAIVFGIAMVVLAYRVRVSRDELFERWA